MANINFKGIKQVVKATFDATADADKIGYLWLVREPKSQSDDDGGKKVDNFSIYFGTRRYAENDVFFHENLVKTFGGLLDDEGGFVFPVTDKGFTSISESEINDLNGLLLALDKAIKANQDSIKTNKAALAAVDGKISTAKEEAITAAGEARDEALKEYAKSADVTTAISEAKTELEGKIAEAGKVVDVTVDGKSVVDESKVANIVIPVYGLEKTGALTYQLTKKVGNADAEKVEGAVINIPEDQFIKDISFHQTKEEGAPEDIVAPYLKFEWKLDTDPDTEGEQKVTYVPVADLVKIYTAGTAIEITAENGINVKVAENSEEKKNFLEVEDDGLAVRGIDADKTVITQKIPVAGGPLAELLNNAGIKELTSDMSITDILTAMVAKEVYPTTTNTAATVSASIKAPSLSGNIANNATAEVGTEFILNDVVTNATTISSTPSKVTGLAYGYSTANNNKAESTQTQISKTVTTGISNDTYELSATVSGFSANGAATVPTTVTGDGSATIASVKIGAIVEGSNKITITEKGAIAKGSADAIDPVYIVSNFGKTKEDAKTTALAAVVDKLSSRPSASDSITITGAYKYFMGYSDNTTIEQFDSDSVRALTAITGNVIANGTTTIVGDAKKISNGKSIVIACPSKYKLATINNGLGANILENFSVNGTVGVKTGAISTTYNVYIYPITNSAEVEFKNVTLAKA